MITLTLLALVIYGSILILRLGYVAANVGLNSIKNRTATIVRTSSHGSIPEKTWISFDDGSTFFETDADLSRESIEDAFNKSIGSLPTAPENEWEPFSFQSDYVSPVCIFNGTKVKANITGPMSISCTSPPSSNAQGGGTIFQISSNDGLDTTGSRFFVYLSSQRGESLYLQPNHGPSMGGTKVYVKGITSGPIFDIVPQTLCKFGDHVSYAAEVDKNGEYVACISPSHSVNGFASTVKVDVSVLGQSAVFTSVGVMFRYDNEYSVSSLKPTSGPVFGGTKVKIHGGTFHNSNELACRFGDKVVNASWHDTNEISCISPVLGWVDEIQRVSVFTMASNPEIQTVTANVEDYVNEIHTCQTYGETNPRLEEQVLEIFFNGTMAVEGSLVIRLMANERRSLPLVLPLTSSQVENVLNDILDMDSIVVTKALKAPNEYSYTIHAMANIPEIKVEAINSPSVSYSIKTIQNGTDNVSDDEEGRGFRLVTPGGSLTYPLTQVTRWIHFDESEDGMRGALNGLLPEGFTVNRRGPFASQTYQWEIVLPKNKTFEGETLHVVDSGGGSIKLKGTNASVSCALSQQGTKKLDGQFRLSFSAHNGYVEFSRAISHNATNDEMKAALEELHSIGSVTVNSVNFDKNMSGSGALQWHVTFDSLKNAGDLPLLAAEYTSQDAFLLGTSASVDVSETRKGSSNAVFKIKVPLRSKQFKISFNGIEGSMLPVQAPASQVMEVLEAIGCKSVVVEKYNAEWQEEDEYYFLDIMGYSLEGKLKAMIFNCDENDISCPLHESRNATLHVAGTALPLGGYFTLQYTSSKTTCKGCRDLTDPISVFATASQFESSLESLDLVDDVTVTIAESERFEEYKVSVESGIVGANRNFYVHFQQKNFSSSSLTDGPPLLSTSFSGDIPMLIVNQDRVFGEPTRDAAHLFDYHASVTEIVKGKDINYGGTVSVAVSLNGVDFSTKNPYFEYIAVPSVRRITPTHGSVTGGTKVRLTGENFSRNSVRSCLFYGIESGFVEIVPVTKYIEADVNINERFPSIDDLGAVCITPASLVPQDVFILVFANEEFETLEETVQTRGKLFHYHEKIEITSVHPVSSKTTGNVTVDIFGSHFFVSEGLFCMFGKAIVPASFVSSIHIRCKTPALATGRYALEITLNRQDYTKSGQVFRFYHDYNIHAISPASGPSQTAGTNVKVYGENFVNSTSLLCRFGLVAVPATFISSSEIRCSTPPVEKEALSWLVLPDKNKNETLSELNPFSHVYPRYLGKWVDFEVTGNGQDYTECGLKFLYQNDIGTSRLSRVEGPSNGGTPIFISGSSFGKRASFLIAI